jgi:hypothetical protein
LSEVTRRVTAVSRTRSLVRRPTPPGPRHNRFAVCAGFSLSGLPIAAIQWVLMWISLINGGHC